MDILYTVRHSQYDDWELRYSLRSVNQYMPWVRKVWIFGDRPRFLSDNKDLVEHVPHEYLAPLLGCRTPVTNTFLMLILSSFIPELSSEYLWFADDYMLLDYLSEQDARKTRYVSDLSRVKTRETGLFKDALWRTYDVLKRLGFTGWNFESHTPTLLTKRRVLDAYLALRDYVSQDRFYGLLAPTAILNHAYSREQMEVAQVVKEGRRIAFYRETPAYEEVVKRSEGKLFLNLDDGSFSEGMFRFLAERFPVPSVYERREAQAGAAVPPRKLPERPNVSLEAVFGRIYRNNSWRSKETVSGPGSTVKATANLRAWLIDLCRTRGIRTIVDLGCGDWNWMRLLAPNVAFEWYRGFDIVPELIEHNRQRYGSDRTLFEKADITCRALPKADLVICRDCLTHFSGELTGRLLAAVRDSGSKYFLATTFPSASNRDVEVGRWHAVNLSAPPWNLPTPDDSVLEGAWPKHGEKRTALFNIAGWTHDRGNDGPNSSPP